ncbi:hypothetical protein V1515DRAFT_616471 [Lipomyces mesembrius]
MAWLPLCIDAAELVPCGLGWDDWMDMTFSALREFGMPAGTGTSSTFLAFEHFAIFACGWSRACWVSLEREFRAHMTGEFPGASRSRIAYLSIWLLENGFTRGTIERAPFKFDEELADDDDYLAAVRVPPPALPSGLWSRRTW